MESRYKQLAAQIRAKANHNLALLDRVKSEGRDLTDAEQKQLDADLTEIKAMREERERMEKGSALWAELNGSGPGPFDGDALEQRKSLEFAVATKQSRRVEIGRKAFTTTGLTLPAAGQTVVGAPLGAAATALRELFPAQLVDTPTVRYYTVAASTGGPAVVAEGGLKPELGNVVTPKDAALVKLAGRVVLTTEMSEDAPFVVSELMRQALVALVRLENAQVLAAMDVSGILTATGAKATALDLIATAIGSQEALNGLRPDALIVNPADLAYMRSLKSSGSGDYLVGDPLAASPVTVWGVPVMSTPALTAGTVWLARKDAGVFYQRGPVTITTGHSGDDMDYNRTTTVFEERVLPVVTSPSLLTKITLT